MRPIQILMDEGHLKALDREARRRKTDRSKLIRGAVESFLRASHVRSLEEQHRRGYEKYPMDAEETKAWEAIEAWPED